MYRPTVRYSDEFRDYVNQLFQSTTLDRNQIIRGALFAAAHSKEFHSLLKPYLKDDVLPPSPTWSIDDDRLWREQSANKREGGKDVNHDDSRGKGENEKAAGAVGERKRRDVSKEKDVHEFRRQPQNEGPTRAIRSRSKNSGGITIKIG
ncbi:hypothetical protein WAK64_20640 [Bacillus spongiae]|uniref:Uncharacterized protein n=1 Tax=Bacillus spongiae TaxID=2683610 RepID=A0ABU8HJK3_9BACI